MESRESSTAEEFPFVCFLSSRAVVEISQPVRTENHIISGLTIRRFRIQDYEPLVDLWKTARLPYKPGGRDARDRIDREIQGPNAIFLVAEVAGQLIGSVFATHDGRKGWINRLAVAPSYRRRRVARSLMAEAEKRLSKAGIEIVACLIEDWNADSKLFFEKIGYHRFDKISYFTKKKHPDV
jgi:ribosomal protein S18 acetylase RimI-like enzyme